MGLRKGKKSKNQDSPLPAPGLPMPPGALPPLPLPPPGANLPPMPLPSAAPLPPAAPVPAPLPAAPLPPIPTPVGEPQPSNDPDTSLSSIAENKGYGDLWAKRSNKPLPQIYGHIDRITNKEAGSLLDRYADRFGHSLDREIIVMRKQELADKVAEVRDAPIVELIDDEPSSAISPEDELRMVESELRELKPAYQEAKASGDAASLAEMKPQLVALMNRRKELQAQQSTSVVEAHTAEPSNSQSDELFTQFVGIVDDLLGSNLPDSIVTAFMASPEFGIYQEVGGSPETASDEMKAQFYNIVDDQLGNMSPESIEAFVSSPDFSIYSSIGEQYKDV